MGRFRLAMASLAPSLLLGCPSTDGFTGGGDSGGDVAPPPGDASNGDASDAGAPDASSDARCDPNKPFALPASIPSIDDGIHQVMAGRLSADELTIVYTQNDGTDGGSNDNVYLATRPTTGDAFGSGAPITAVNSAADDFDPFLLDDDLTLYFSSLRVSPIQFFVSHRTSPTQAFGAPKAVPSNGIADDVLQVFFLADGVTAFFTDSAAVNAIDEAQITPDAGIVNPQNVLTPDQSYFPVVTGDGLTMLYDYQGNGAVWITTRTSPSALFGSGAPVPELAAGGATITQPTWVSRDGCEIVVQSDRGQVGLLQLYVAQRGK